MKYHITEQQWFEITSKQRADFLRAIGSGDEHIVGVGMILPLPPIGELIAFLDAQTRERGWLTIATPGERHVGWRVQCKYADFDEDGTPELCDALWNGVKILLNEEKS